MSGAIPPHTQYAFMAWCFNASPDYVILELYHVL